MNAKGKKERHLKEKKPHAFLSLWLAGTMLAVLQRNESSSTDGLIAH